MSTPRTVAVACQGGGSHTAFTAGVLDRLLERHGDDYRVTALSGTSGGALCAFAAWYGLRTGGPETARRALETLWDRIEADSPFERAVNYGAVLNATLSELGVPTWTTNPSISPAARLGQAFLEDVIESVVDDVPVSDLLVSDPTRLDEDPPTKLLVSAVDATDGSFDVFSDRPDLEADADLPDGPRRLRETTERLTQPPRPISTEAVLASTAVPPLFDAVDIPESGDSRYYWDGLLAQNPPIRNLLSGPGTAAHKPDEIWLVRIEPTTKTGPFDSLPEISDRRTELSGNISLEQELYFVRTVNRWIADGRLTAPGDGTYKPVTVREIALEEDRLDPPRSLRTASKYNRDFLFIEELQSVGRQQADAFLDDRAAYTIVSDTPV